MEEETKQDTCYCSNCKKDIPALNFLMHEPHCRRNIVLCKVCDEPVPKSQLEEHHEENHVEAPCELCHKRMAKDHLEQHQEEECPQRKILCKYCSLQVKAVDYTEHEDACGSRTDECDQCSQRVMLRYMDDHVCGTPRPLINNPYRPQYPLRRVLNDSSGIQARPYQRDPSIPTVHSVNDTIFGGGVIIPYPITALDGMVNTTSQEENGGDGLSEEAGSVFPMRRPHNPTVVVDRDWLGSVSNAVDDETELDSVIAKNIYYEDMRRVQTHIPDNDEEDTTAGRVVNTDEEMARKLQQQLQHESSINDMSYVQQLQQSSNDDYDPPDTLNDSRYARQLYEQLNDIHDPSEPDTILAQQLQDEEKYESKGLPTMVIYDRAMIKNQEEEEKRRQLEEDEDMARRLHDEEQENYNPHLYDHDTEHDPDDIHIPPDMPVGNDYPKPNVLESDQLEPDLYGVYHVPEPIPNYVQESNVPVVYNDPGPTRYHVSEPNPPEEPDTSIPCDLCNENIEFENYREHMENRHPQYGDVIDRFHNPPRYIPRPLYSQPYRPDIDEEEHVKKVMCQFCGFQHSSSLIKAHEAICDENPEKHLKDVYTREPPVYTMEEEKEDSPLPEEDIMIPCEFCDSSFRALYLEKHQEICGTLYRSRLGIHGNNNPPQLPIKEQHNEDDEPVNTIPCELCEELIPITELHKHQAMCSVKPQISSKLPHHKPVSMPIVSTSSSTTATKLPHDVVSTSTSTRNVLLESLTSSKSRKPPTQTSSLVSSYNSTKPPSYNKQPKIKLAANFETKKSTTKIGNDELRNKKPVGYVHRRPDDPDQNSSLPVTNGKPRTTLIRTLHSNDVVSGRGKSTYNPRRYKDSSSRDEYGIVFEDDETSGTSQRLKQSARGQRNNPPNARGFNGSRGRNGSNYGLHVTGSEIPYGNSKKETGRERSTQGRKTMNSETPFSSRSDYKDRTSSIRPSTDEKRRPYSNSHVTKSS